MRGRRPSGDDEIAGAFSGLEVGKCCSSSHMGAKPLMCNSLDLLFVMSLMSLMCV